MSNSEKKFDFKSLLNSDIKDLNKKIYKRPNKRSKSFSEKKKKVIAFDMGSTVIKIVIGIFYRNSLKIDEYYTMPTPQNAIVDGEIKREDELILRLSELIKENGIQIKYAICTTNCSLIINREITIPKVEEDEIDTVVRYEIQQYLPINLEDYILQVTVLNEDEVDKTKKMNVRVIAYPEKIARGYYNVLTKLSLKPYVLDVNYNAVNKFINYTKIGVNEYKTKHSIGIIDFGANFIDVNIYKNEQLDFTRIIKGGSNDINNTLHELKNISFEECEELKKNGINIFNENDSLNTTVREIIDEWIEKIEKIFQFYKNKGVGNNVDQIFIFGGASKIEGLEKYISDKIGISTRKMKKINKMTFDSEDDGEPIDDFINVIGAVIRS